MNTVIKIPILIAAAMVLLSWADNWEDLKKSTGDINSIQADFVQRKQAKMLDRPLVSRGRLLFKAPGSLRWEYTAPVKSVLLVNAGDIQRYVMEKGSYKKGSGSGLQSMSIVFSEIIKWLNGKFDSNPDFEAEIVTGVTNKIVLTPKRRAMLKYISSIELTLSKRPGVINRVRIDERDGNYTLITFTGVALNSAVPAGTFEKP